MSRELWITIVPATPEWQAQTLKTALATLGQGRSEVFGRNPEDSVHRAGAVLRYLGTPAAAVEMASRLNDKDVELQFKLGLASTPAKEAALQKLEALLHDAAFPINATFLNTMSLVALPPEEITDRPGRLAQLEERFRQELLSALGSKRGKALAVSAYTIVEDAAIFSRELAADQKRRLTAQLVAGFDDLPRESQIALLEYRWESLDTAAILPLLPKIAQRYKDYSELRETNTYEANQFSSAALTRWFELDPENARPAVIQEILRPKPRFGAAVLGMLPDKELPEVEQQLAGHLTANHGSEEQIASLISRFATASIEGQVIAYVDEHLGKSACAVQTPLLAYLLRIDPTAALPRIEKGLAARGPAFSACNTTLLVQVADLQNNSALQEVARTSLDDDDPQIVANAAAYLGRYGSASAEAPLWDRLIAWSAQWNGREAELRHVPGEKLDGTFQPGAGSNLMWALSTGQGWLTDDKKLRRLIELSVVPDQRRRAEQVLAMWQERPRQIRPVGKGRFQIAQYDALSLKAATEKLGQFSGWDQIRLERKIEGRDRSKSLWGTIQSCG